MEEKKINVGLYGGKSLLGGREAPLRAETIYCDSTEYCPLYEKGMCLNVKAPFRNRCKFGRVCITKGCTSRAKKYMTFKTTYQKDNTYNKLSYPNNCMIAKIGDYVYLNIPHIRYDENNKPKSPYMGMKKEWFKIEEVTAELIKDICDLKPKSMFGGTIDSHKEEDVPELLLQLHRNLPNIYKKLLRIAPYLDKEFNYVGKQAFVYSLKDGVVIKHKDSEFIKQNGKLTCSRYRTLFAPFEAKEEDTTVIINIKDYMLTEITSNEQVDEDTIFQC